LPIPGSPTSRKSRPRLRCSGSRIASPRLGDKAVEPLQVELAVAGDQHVSRGAGQAACRRIVAPDVVEQSVGGDDGVRAQRESGEQSTLADPSERKRATLLDHLQRPQDPEFHARGRTFHL
jgi:hypothetical protein